MATWLFGTQLLHVSIIPPFLDFPIMFHWTRCSPMDWICQLPYSRTFALTSQTSKHRGARSGLFSFFFSPFFVQEGARMLHLTKTYLISIFSPLCYFLRILIKQGKKKNPVGLKIVALNVQSSVCLEMNIQDSCCVLKDPRVAGLLWSSSQQNVFYWLSK